MNIVLLKSCISNLKKSFLGILYLLASHQHIAKAQEQPPIQNQIQVQVQAQEPAPNQAPTSAPTQSSQVSEPPAVRIKKEFKKGLREHSPLELAVIHDEYFAVEKLLKEGANPNGPSNKGFPILFAVIKNNLGILEILLKKGANPNKKLPNGLTALHWATFHNQIGIAKILLDNGADPKIKLNGADALTLAQEANYEEIAKLIQKY